MNNNDDADLSVFPCLNLSSAGFRPSDRDRTVCSLQNHVFKYYFVAVDEFSYYPSS